MATFEDYLFTKNTKWLLWGLGGLVVVVLIFHVGVVIGARHNFRPTHGMMGREFRAPFGGFMMPEGFMPQMHGAVGTVASVTLPTFIVTEQDGEQETVFLATTTLVRNDIQGATSTALMPGAHVIVLGWPDENVERIDARFIRIVP